MTDLSQELRQLGQTVFPPTPHLAGAVRSQLERPAVRPRRWLVPAVAAAVLLMVLAAVPQTRQAIAGFFGIGAVRFDEMAVGDLPVLAMIDNPPGGLTTMEEARGATEFEIRALPGNGFPPPEVYLHRAISGGMVTLVYRVEGEPVLALTQLVGAAAGETLVKGVGGEVTVVPTRVAGADAFWVEGPHLVVVIDPVSGRFLEPLLAGNALLWQEGEVTYRLEGGFTLDQARTLAESLEPLS